MSLKAVSQGKNNNLNFLRFIAAIMVVLCHSYPLGIGREGLDPLEKLTRGQIHFGELAVYIFFFFSGFWISRSVQKGLSFCSYIKARCIRIFPCLIVVVLLCTFGLGTIVTELSWEEYLVNPKTYEYLLNSVLLLKHDLPGVFEHNIYDSTINGSLWTLPVEFLCYIGCYFTWYIGLVKENTMKFTIPAFIMGYILMSILLKDSLLLSALSPCGMFYCGMLYNVYRERIYIGLPYFFVCILGLFLSIHFCVLKYSVFVFLPYILVFIVFGTKKKWGEFGRKYEISYGIYLSAFPIQQTVTMLFGGSMKPIWNFLISIPFILIIGWLLTVLVENSTLRLVRKKI